MPIEAETASDPPVGFRFLSVAAARPTRSTVGCAPALAIRISCFAMATARLADRIGRLRSSAVSVHASMSAGSGIARGMSVPRAASSSGYSPMVSRIASRALSRAFLASISRADARSKRAFASSTSVTAMRPTSKRSCACRSCWPIASRLVSAKRKSSRAWSTPKYRSTTRSMSCWVLTA